MSSVTLDRRLPGENPRSSVTRILILTRLPKTLVTPVPSKPDRAGMKSERYCCGALTANAGKGGGAFLSFAS